MFKKIFIFLSLALILSFVLVACGGGEANDIKEIVNAQSPGAIIVSTQKSTEKINDYLAWCVVYQQKNGMFARMLITEKFIITNAGEDSFNNLGCSNWK